METKPPELSSNPESYLSGLGVAHPLFEFIWQNCHTCYLKDKFLFTANITLCGYDYYCLAEKEIDAKLDLCNMLLKSKYIMQNFTKK